MMATNRTLLWRLGIAAAALSAAIAVYLLARLYPPALLEPFRATSPAFAAQADIFGNLPALFYTLAMGLLVGVFSATPTDARRYCLLWIGLALVLELTQHPLIAEPLSNWLSAILATSIWEVVGPYWIRGTFDPIDMLATLVGGLIALVLLTYRGKKDTQGTV